MNFGAVDYFSTIYVNGEFAGRHWGGSSSFSIDVTRFVKAGEKADVVVWVKDDLRSGEQTGGKQCTNYKLWHSNCANQRDIGKKPATNFVKFIRNQSKYVIDKE